MIEKKKFRNDFDLVCDNLVSRGVKKEVLIKLRHLDITYRKSLQYLESLKQNRNMTASEMKLKKSATLKKEMKDLKNEIETYSIKVNLVKNEIDVLYNSLPNLINSSSPVGDETQNHIVRTWGEIEKKDFNVKPHWEITELLNLADFDRAAKVTGRRFVFYKNIGALLCRALQNYMLDTHINEHNYIEMVPPYLLNNESMYGSGQFPKFKDDVFQLKNNEWTIMPTAEIPLINYFRDEILDVTKLPINFTAMSPSFRSESDSAGRDTRGLIRLHQFNKVEMVKITDKHSSYQELEKLTSHAERILQDLKLPYQVVLLSTEDTGFSSAKTYDLEVWLPGQNKYREISSCSNCESFQARRAMIRYKENGLLDYVHTLNGTGIAIDRAVAAILENYQTNDGSIIIPEVLKPYMNNIDIIEI